MKRIEAVNDFVIKFANVNGSGSACPLFRLVIYRLVEQAKLHTLNTSCDCCTITLKWVP